MPTSLPGSPQGTARVRETDTTNGRCPPPPVPLSVLPRPLPEQNKPLTHVTQQYQTHTYDRLDRPRRDAVVKKTRPLPSATLKMDLYEGRAKWETTEKGPPGPSGQTLRHSAGKEPRSCPPTFSRRLRSESLRTGLPIPVPFPPFPWLQGSYMPWLTVTLTRTTVVMTGSGRA